MAAGVRVCPDAASRIEWLWALTQGYVWLGWAAYCTWVGLHFVLDPDVNNP